ncbi:hypothetical protein [Stratiformator vulcanicus]|uniref:Uncharacterized protein n=1 Tax=Stratiformator vulcanicus TaxID=2527980 RepID=A0A517R707_9PLAN|nr:hypothetical protein [Stratiformator vulcanicus]QDT39655.1 hypothetical protein Pan189_40640 [Stratiformator vulcanicus]
MRSIATILILVSASNFAVAAEPFFQFRFEWVTEDDLRRDRDEAPSRIEVEIGRPALPPRPFVPESDTWSPVAPVTPGEPTLAPPAPTDSVAPIEPDEQDELGASTDSVPMPVEPTELAAAPSDGPEMPDTDVAESEGGLSEREQKFADLLTNAVMTGSFTIIGKNNEKLRPERYEIASAKKLSDSKWAITARIKYGKNDFNLPIVVDVFWADDTPVISLTDLTIPGMGTFGARVLFHKEKYAGTWRHDAVGGHMFGTIKPAEQTLPNAGE